MIPARQPQDPADVLAAMAGEDLSELPRLWNQQIGVIRSRPLRSTEAHK